MNLFKKLRKHPDLKSLDDDYLKELIDNYQNDPEDFFNELADEPLSEKEAKIIRNYLS